ncbi:MAG: hypothetical protein HY556_00515 [Euryarchaeota archaeon]|nr:hypothetical protein [Euryarchaeota archaeon]
MRQPQTRVRRIIGLTTIGLFFIVPIGIASTDTVTYSGVRTSDLFPDEQRIDLYVTVTGAVSWKLGNATIPPGGSTTTMLEPSPRNLTFTADYSIHPACCPRGAIDSTKTLPETTPIGCHDTSFTDSGWTITLTLCGTLRATPSATLGIVTPRALQWDSNWDAKTLNISTEANAEDRQVVNLTVPTFYDFSVRAKVSGYGASWQSPTLVVDAIPSDHEIQEHYIVTPASPAKTPTNTTLPEQNAGETTVTTPFTDSSPQPNGVQTRPTPGVSPIIVILGLGTMAYYASRRRT